MEQEIIKSRIGETRLNTLGSKMWIIEYISYNDITVQFEDSYVAEHRQYSEFKKGKIKSPNDRSIFGIGYLGKGKYKPYSDDYKATKQYEAWKNMLQRCYNKEFQIKHPSYIGCTVCDEWLNFQNFAEWYNSNYYSIEGEKTCLDKDILIKGNKIYSPKACIFAPQSINNLFVSCYSLRGDLPVGVVINSNGKYEAHCSNGKKIEHLGSANSKEEAFEIYKEFKEYIIKQLAEEYKKLIPRKLYKAMYNYIVEIDD